MSNNINNHMDQQQFSKTLRQKNDKINLIYWLNTEHNRSQQLSLLTLGKIVYYDVNVSL